MFFYIAIIASIIGLTIATYTDLKERIVPNKLNFGMTIIGLIIFGTQSIFETSFLPIAFSIIGLCIGFFFGWVLWKIGVFAGGDVKLFMALGALNPFTPALLKIFPLTNSSLPLFPISLFIYSLIAFLPYGIIVMLYKLKQNKEIRKKIFKEMKGNVILGIYSSIIIASLHSIIILVTNNLLIESVSIIVLLFVIGFFGKKKPTIAIVLIFFGIILNPFVFAIALVGALIIIVGLYGLIKLMLSLRIVLTTEIGVSKLEEGMIPSKSLAWKGKKVIELDPLSFKKIIKNLTNAKNISFTKKEIISANKARGLDEEELKEVRLLAKKGLIGKTMKIKDSMPFVPTMLIGYAISLFVGDAIIFIFMGV